MSRFFRPPLVLCALVLIGAIAFLWKINAVRAERVSYVSALAQSAPLAVDAASPTGYAGGIRQLIVPEHNHDSYEWIAQTQQMLTRHEWRLRHVDYDNAPDGRDVRTPSPYRWWLGLVSWFESKRTGQPLAPAVERAALFADPALQILLLIASVAVAAWCFGAIPATLLGLAFATLFPFASAFQPAQVDDYGLSLAVALWSVLPLLAGVQARAAKTALGDPTARRWFFCAGLVGGFGLWLNVTRELPVLCGIALGGLFAASLTRRDPTAKPLPWRAWTLGGASATLVAFLIEYFPAYLALSEWRLETIHPLYALAWLGVGELLLHFEARMPEGKTAWTRRRVATTLMALLAVAAVPTLIFLQEDRAWLMADAFRFRLTNLPGGPTAGNLGAWIVRDHLNAAAFATFVPLLLLAPAAWLLLRRTTATGHRIALAFVAGPLLVALAFACVQLRGWNFVDSALLAFVVAVSAALGTPLGRWLWSGLVVLVLIPGLIQSLPPSGVAATDAVTETEVIALVERDLAHWLANRAGPGGAIVLAPPSLTASLYYHGGLRGIGTPYADNKGGFAAAVRLASVSSVDEAQVLIRKRNVTHIVMPSWETFLDEYARLGSNQPDRTLVGLLHQWLAPRWLRPLPYHLPQIPGFESQSVALFEVVEIRDNATALSELAEYFAEMGQLDQAAAVRHALEQSFPNEIGSLVAQAQVAIALRDGAAFIRIVNTLVPRLAEDEAQGLAWERRVNLAIVLTEGKRRDAARAEVERCLAEMDEPLLRSLPPATLYRLQVLTKAFGLEIAEPTLRTLASSLLPPEMRSAL